MARTQYSKFFPMLHARYRMTAHSNLRAAITRALVRPNFYDLTPYRLRDGREGRFPGQAQHVVNAALSHEKGGFSGQLSLNFIDEFVDEFSGNVGDRAEDIFVDQRTQLNLSANYRFSLPFSIFAEVNNLTNKPFGLYQGNAARPRQSEYYERWGRIGLRCSL